ncbi:MAG TPA: ribonuclease HII [Thermoanaerobaculia bacterium]|nr:ribonuclease HII [Thermoanaerobaculia bacterium]
MSRSTDAEPPAPESPPVRIRDLFAEAYRLRLLRALEEQLAHCGFVRVAGTDEAGRGALAGPVVAAAVILDFRCLLPGVDDSKCLPPADRERLAGAIRECCVGLAVASVPAKVIDRVNILEASRLAMRQALAALTPPPDCAVVDAVALPGLGFPCLPVVRGDIISYAVACASIIAKVERDRLMVELGSRFPHYGFAAHKGYGVPEHLEALAVHGPCPEHRLTFQPVLPRRTPRGLPAAGWED